MESLDEWLEQQHLHGGGKNRKLRCHTSGCLAYCEIGHEKGWIKDINCHLWSRGI